MKSLLNFVFSSYDIFQIFSLNKKSPKLTLTDGFEFIELNATALAQYSGALLDKNKSYLGTESKGFACIHEQQIVGLCFFWSGQRYQKRNFIKLAPDQAKLVQIETLESMRGQGIAPNLIKYAAANMLNHNFNTVYARIWHSNTSSIKSFTKAGWQYERTIIALKMRLGLQCKFTWPFN